MKEERTYLIALLVLALLASIPQIPVDAGIWGGLLALIGVIGGLMLSYDANGRLLIYVVAVALPMFDNSLDSIWVVGSWLNMLLDNVAHGIQGLAVGVFAMGLLGRLQGGGSSG